MHIMMLKCTNSVKLEGPTLDTLQLIKQHNPCGFMAFMVNNRDNLMVGIAAEEDFKLDVFNTECRIYL